MQHTATSHQTVGDGSTLRLDVPSVESAVAHYPEELKEPVIWLANFVREECVRDLDILVDLARKLSIEFDKTTWSKVLRGRFNRDGDNKPLDTPIVNPGKLLRALNSLRNDARLREVAGKVAYILTPTGEVIWSFLDKKRAPDRVNRFGMIVGHTGTQKTASLREYCRRNNHGSCVLLEAPSTASQTQFITDLAEKYGCSRQAAWDRKRNTIAKSVNDRRTIMVENVQRLYNPHEREGSQKVFDYLQKLQEDTGCTIILTLTPVFRDMLRRRVADGYFEQFIGRAGGERDILCLEEYPSEEDVLCIANAFGLQAAAEQVEYLNKIVREPGRVRCLFEALQEGKIAAERAKKKLTIAHVRAARGED